MNMMFNPQASRLIPLEQHTKKGQDVRDGSIYVCDQVTVMAVNIALATGRPLLLCGPPGSGKSSLASYIAKTMNWNYFEKVITSQTQAQDLLWTVDHVRRLRDAHVNNMCDDDLAYIKPQVLWWAFDSDSAKNRGFAKLPEGVNPVLPPGIIRDAENPSVVLFDEVDKADPDVPNDLLVALGSQQFEVPDLSEPIKPRFSPLVLITTNDERALPKAFLRRCAVHVLKPPKKSDLIERAMAHFPYHSDKQDGLFSEIADKVIQVRDQDPENVPSTAEYLDAISACLEFDIGPDDDKIWPVIDAAIFLKKVGID